MTAFDKTITPWPSNQLSILANALGSDVFIEQMGFQSFSGDGYVTAVDSDELTDPSQGATENSFLLIQDVDSEEYAALSGQFNNVAMAVGTRFIATAMQSSLVSKPVPPDQLIYNLLNDTAVYEECKTKLGLGKTVFLYFSLLCYKRYEDDLEGYEGVNLAIHDKGDNIGTAYEVAVFDRTFVDARSEDARIEFISKFIRPLIEDWFAAINWDEGSGGTASAVATANANSGQTSLDIAAKYPKVSLLQYKAFLENESNWNGIITEKILELFVDSMIPWGYGGVSGTSAGHVKRAFTLSDLTHRISLLKNMNSGGFILPGLPPVYKERSKFLDALANPNPLTNINIINLLGFQEVQAIQDLPETADADGDGVISAPELAAQLNAAGNNLLDQTFGLYRQLSGQQLSDDDLRAGNQCALISGLLYGGTSEKNVWKKYWLLDSRGNLAKEEKNRISPLGKPEGDRIYPVMPEGEIAPREFMNICEANRNINRLMEELANDQTRRNKRFESMSKELWWVYEDGGQLKETKLKLTSEIKEGDTARTDYAKYEDALRIYHTEGNERAKTERLRELLGDFAAIDEASLVNALSNATPTFESVGNFFSLNNIKINYKGGNPATARSDVTVDMSFTLSSLQALTDVSINEDTSISIDGKKRKLDIRLYNLITLPNFGTVQSGIGSNLKNQFHPDYSRVRLKVYPTFTPKGMNAIILDLCTVDHSIDRSGKDGLVTLTISLRGYYENLVDMPEHDILVGPAERKSRIELKRKIDKLTKDGCPKDQIKEITKEKREVYGRTKRKYQAIFNRLQQLKCIHYYGYDRANITKIITGISAIDAQYLNKVAYQNPAPGNATPYAFFFLGDLIYVMLDALYEQDSVKYLETAKNLNTRLVVGSIQVPLVGDAGPGFVNINPLCLPIDLIYFNQWFNVTIINKGIESMTIGLFLKELLEKFVNNVLMEICFSGLTDSFPTPEFALTNKFTTERKWFKKNGDKFLDPLNPYQTGPGFANLFKKSAYYKGNPITRNVVGHNYLTVYPRYHLPIKSVTEVNVEANGETLKSSPYCPTIFYGRLNDTYNFVSDVKLSKQNTPHLRESRFSSADFGNLSLLAGVYDLSFSFVDVAANTLFYPGTQLNLVLLDWGAERTMNPYVELRKNRNDFRIFKHNNPHDPQQLAFITGLGGYFMILSSTYSIGLDDQDFTISISAKFSGTDGTTELRLANKESALIDEKTDCTTPVANGQEINEGDGSDDETPQGTITDINPPEDVQNGQEILEKPAGGGGGSTGGGSVNQSLITKSGITKGAVFVKAGASGYKVLNGGKTLDNFGAQSLKDFNRVPDGTKFVIRAPDLLNTTKIRLYIFTVTQKDGVTSLVGKEATKKE